MKRYLFNLFAVMAFVTGAFAQNSISGTIVDAKTNKGIPYVNVGVFRQVDSVFVSGGASNEKGDFELQGVPNGMYDLKVTAIGYESFQQALEVKKNVKLEPIKLNEGATKLSEVVISEKRPLFAVEGEKTMYNTAEDPSIQTGTASDALQNAPGVTVDVEGNISLRGTSNVEVWINDRPSHMSGENLKTYIQQMPANSIDHIEVITNPSARYGSSADGIINIVTNAKIKKNHFVSFGVNASPRPYVSPWVSYVWSNEKLSVNAYANVGYFRYFSSGVQDQSLYVENQLLANHQIDTSASNTRQINGGLFISVDYEIDSANSLNLWANWHPSWNNSDISHLAYREEYLDENGNSLLMPLVTDYKEIYTNRNYHTFAMGGLYYQHKFDNEGHNLSVSMNAMGYGGNGPGKLIKEYTLPFVYRKEINSYTDSKNIGGGMEIVYNRPYSENGEISLGLNSSYSPVSAVVQYDTLALDHYITDEWRSYSTKFRDFNNDFFITWQRKFGNFTMKPGIRFCSSFVSFPDSLNTANETKHFFALRPSLHLSYRTKSMHNFSASYTRRISNPEASELTQFVIYDEDNFKMGNPNLKSWFTNSVELGWTKYWEKFGSVGLSAYYRDIRNGVSDDTPMSMYHPLYGRVVTYTYPVNVGYSSTKGADMNVMFRPSGFFNVRLSAGVYDTYLKTEFENQEHSNYMICYNFNLYVWAKLWNKLEVTASGYYSSPTQMSMFSKNHGNYGINCGLRADFFDRKMSVFLKANDIFDWGQWGASNYSPYVQSTSNIKYSSRMITAGITFRFGKMELERMAKQGAETGGVQGGGM